MKRIIVISDTHGDTKKMKKILKKEKYDLSIHLGDSDLNTSELDLYFDHYVIGNNDFNNAPLEKIIEVEGVRLLLMHGHMIFTFDRTNQTKFARYAEEMKVDALLFGHYHFPIKETINNKLILNPGAIRYPRNGSKSTYLILEINDKKIQKVNFIVLK